MNNSQRSDKRQYVNWLCWQSYRKCVSTMEDRYRHQNCDCLQLRQKIRLFSEKREMPAKEKNFPSFYFYLTRSTLSYSEQVIQSHVRFSGNHEREFVLKISKLHRGNTIARRARIIIPTVRSTAEAASRSSTVTFRKFILRGC